MSGWKKRKKEKKGFNPLGKEREHFTCPVLEKHFGNGSFNLPNCLERDDHQTGTDSQLIRDVPTDPAHGGHIGAAPQHPSPAPGIWSASDRFLLHLWGVQLNPQFRRAHKSARYQCSSLLSSDCSKSRPKVPPLSMACCSVSPPKVLLPSCGPALPASQISNNRIIGMWVGGKGLLCSGPPF